MSNRLKYEEIKRFIEIESDSNCKLLSTEYKTSKDKLMILCSCGETFETTYYDFKRTDKRQKRKCSYCTGTKVKDKICPICKSKFKPIKKKQIYCSVECRSISRKKKVLVNCSYCYKEIEKAEYALKRSDRLYCSNNCRYEHQKVIFKSENNPNFKGANLDVKCSNCGIEFNILTCHTKNSDGSIKQNLYCSTECKAEHQKIILKGENNPRYNSVEIECSFCKKPLYKTLNYIESRNNIFCSSECKADWQSEFLRGENHPMYDFTISKEEREIRRNFDGYAHWRREVYKRDNYTCQICGDNKGGNLNAHHIDGYNWCKERRTAIDNGVTLCDICHDKFHRIYGFGNNTKEQYNEFSSKSR